LLKEQNAVELEVFLAIQADINKVEAGHESVFVAGWRPLIGWACGVAFAYHFVLQSFLAFTLAVAGHPVTLPAFEMTDLLIVLLGMLGLGRMRTVEKKWGVVSDTLPWRQGR
jgi:hypothetical protein